MSISSKGARIAKKTETGLSDNTIGSIVKRLKSFMEWAQEKELHENRAFKKFEVFKHDASIIVLNETEINQIREVDLKGQERQEQLEKVRDIFSVGLVTGASISDLLSWTMANLIEDDGNYLISYVPEKTRGFAKTVEVPVYKEHIEIFKKYDLSNGPLLPKISNQKFNKYLKEIGKLAGIRQNISKSVIMNEQPKPESGEKYQFMGSHLMRRTFITESLKAGMEAQFIMNCSGHSDYSSFKKYVDYSDRDYKVKRHGQRWNRPDMKVSND